MKFMIILANEIPWIMAPATLIAAMVVISVVAVAIRNTEQAFKLATVSVLLVLTLAAMMIQMIIH